jgi:hypothetical protein
LFKRTAISPKTPRNYARNAKRFHRNLRPFSAETQDDFSKNAEPQRGFMKTFVKATVFLKILHGSALL